MVSNCHVCSHFKYNAWKKKEIIRSSTFPHIWVPSVTTRKSLIYEVMNYSSRPPRVWSQMLFSLGDYFTRTSVILNVGQSNDLPLTNSVDVPTSCFLDQCRAPRHVAPFHTPFEERPPCTAGPLTWTDVHKNRRAKQYLEFTKHVSTSGKRFTLIVQRPSSYCVSLQNPKALLSTTYAHYIDNKRMFKETHFNKYMWKGWGNANVPFIQESLSI